MANRSAAWPLYAMRAAVLTALLSAGGCATATIDDAVPTAANAQPADVAAVEAAGAAPRDAINTGTFPNLNIPPQAAAAQITPEERAAALAELKALQNRQASSGGATPSAAEAARLKKLAASHAKDTLAAIEQAQ